MSHQLKRIHDTRRPKNDSKRKDDWSTRAWIASLTGFFFAFAFEMTLNVGFKAQVSLSEGALVLMKAELFWVLLFALLRWRSCSHSIATILRYGRRQAAYLGEAGGNPKSSTARPECPVLGRTLSRVPLSRAHRSRAISYMDCIALCSVKHCSFSCRARLATAHERNQPELYCGQFCYFVRGNILAGGARHARNGWRRKRGWLLT